MKPSFYIFMAVCVCIFLMLGVWQIKRLAWKENLLREVSAELTINAPATRLTNIHLDHAYSIRRGFVTGNLDLAQSLLWQGQIFDGKSVSYVVAPLRVKGQDKILPVVLGMCQADCSEIKPIRHASIKLFGTLKYHRDNMFRAPNNIVREEWYRMDVADLSSKWKGDVVDVLFYAENDNIDPYIRPVPNVLNIPNNHKLYAIFWLSMSAVIAALSVYFFASHRRRA